MDNDDEGIPSRTMPSVFTHEFDTSVYKGKTQFNTGLFINGQFSDGSDKAYIECVGKLLFALPFSSLCHSQCCQPL